MLKIQTDKMGQSASFTFPLMLDVILHIEVHCDVGSHAGRPAFSYLGLGHLHDGEGGDGLRHPGPAAKHHAAVLRLPVRDGGRERQGVRRVLRADVETETSRIWEVVAGSGGSTWCRCLLIYFLPETNKKSSYIA